MMPNSGYELVKIVKGTDYSPAARTADFVDPNLGALSPTYTVSDGYTPPIFALLCTKSTGSGNCEIEALGNDGAVIFPSNAFVKGNVYYIYLKRLIDDDFGGLQFVGFRYANMPLTW